MAAASWNASTRPIEASRTGLIGLGTGTLAAYARAGDTYDFFDIDPKSIRVAQENFTYIVDARSIGAKINLIQRDGRKALDDSKTNYDVIVIDAFTGDGVPSHLLVGKPWAFMPGASRQKTRHPDRPRLSRYSRYYPVVEATARSLNLSAIAVHTMHQGGLSPGRQRTGLEFARTLTTSSFPSLI